MGSEVYRALLTRDYLIQVLDENGQSPVNSHKLGLLTFQIELLFGLTLGIMDPLPDFGVASACLPVMQE